MIVKATAVFKTGNVTQSSLFNGDYNKMLIEFSESLKQQKDVAFFVLTPIK